MDSENKQIFHLEPPDDARSSPTRVHCPRAGNFQQSDLSLHSMELTIAILRPNVRPSDWSTGRITEKSPVFSVHMERQEHKYQTIPRITASDAFSQPIPAWGQG